MPLDAQTTDEETVAKLAADPLVTIGAHTVNHPILTKLDDKAVRSELEESRNVIEAALGTRPAFILLDEPFAGVDPLAVRDIQQIIVFLRTRGIGVLITDHNVRETLGICDRAYIINEGKVLASGSPAHIVENDSVRRVYLGENFRM